MTSNIDTTAATVATDGGVSPFHSLIDPPVPTFTGRNKDLGQIHNLLKGCLDKASYSSRIVVLHGIGGIGKTELVRQYIKNQMEVPAESRIFHSVAWINATTRESAEKSLIELVQNFFPCEGMKLETIANRFYKFYSRNITKMKTCLLIFDNVNQIKDEDPYFGIYNILPIQLPPRSKIPLILITSRNGKWDIPSENIIPIKEMSSQDSEEFLKTQFQLKGSQAQDNENETMTTAIRNLAEEIHHYPLALSLAASNIDKANLIEEIQKYITELKIPNSGWIHHGNHSGTVTSYNLTMKDVWDSTFTKFELMQSEGECALELLILLAYLPIDYLYTIRIKEIAKFCFGNEWDFSRGLETLKIYSFITVLTSEREGTEKEKIEINRHVHRCIKEKMDDCKNFSYLLAICLFFCQQDIHPFYQSNHIVLAMHNLLKERNWPHGSISLSIKFISHSVREDDFQIFKDVNKWLEKENNSDTLNERISVLLDVWRFYFSLTKEYSDETESTVSLPEVSYFHDRCVTFTEIFVEELKLLRVGQDIDLCFGHVIGLNESKLYLRERLDFLDSTRKTIAENENKPNFLFPFIRFKHPSDPLQPFTLSPPPIVGINFFANRWFKLMDKSFKELNEDEKQNICKIVLSALESFPTNLEISDTLKNIELFCKCIRTIKFDTRAMCWLTDTVIKKHLELYLNPKKLDHSTFWRMHFQLYETIVSSWNDSDAAAKKCVADKFFWAEGRELLISHLRLLESMPLEKHLHSFSHKPFDLFGLIIFLARMPIGAEKFVENNDFLWSLKNVIKMAFNSEYGDTKSYMDGQFLSMLSWLAFFDENETYIKTPVPKSLLDSVKTEMEFFEKDLNQDVEIRLEDTLAKNAEIIIAKILLSDFHEFHESANGMYKHLQCIADPEMLGFN